MDGHQKQILFRYAGIALAASFFATYMVLSRRVPDNTYAQILFHDYMRYALVVLSGLSVRVAVVGENRTTVRMLKALLIALVIVVLEDTYAEIQETILGRYFEAKSYFVTIFLFQFYLGVPTLLASAIFAAIPFWRRGAQ